MEDKIEVGEYVRDTEGKIYKIESETLNDFLCIEISSKVNSFKVLSDLDIQKPLSKNIIDLIEVGDYVNGYEVITVYGYDEDGNDKDGLGICEVDDDYAYYLYLKDIDIKSIVTHEQFESMEYKLDAK